MDTIPLSYLRSVPSGMRREARVFSLVRSKRFIPTYDVQAYDGRYGDLLPHLGVPAYATVDRVHNRDGYEVSWRVLMLDSEAYEWIFDHPEFEPHDVGEPDEDQPAIVPTLSIPSWMVTDGSITAKKLNVASLAGISANMGPMVAGTLSGMKADKVWYDEYQGHKDKWTSLNPVVIKQEYQAEWPHTLSKEDEAKLNAKLGRAISDMTESAIFYGVSVPPVANTMTSANSSVLTEADIKRSMAELRAYTPRR
jgi:hypothetical protein